MNGLDFAYMYPGAAWIKANGFGFVVRYLCWPGGKVITKAEFDSYRAEGIDVCLNWEFQALDQLGGAAAGKLHATEAKRQAEALGAWPCVIFFSADWDVLEGDLPAVDAYLKGAAEVLGGPQLVGEYGGFRVVKHAMDTGRAAYGWQTFAWSRGQWHPGAQLRQVAVINAAAAGYAPTGAEYDLDISLAADFGQVGGTMAFTDDPAAAQLVREVHDIRVMIDWVNAASDLTKSHIPTIEGSLAAIQKALTDAAGHPANVPIMAAVAQAQKSLDAIKAKTDKDLA